MRAWRALALAAALGCATGGRREPVRPSPTGGAAEAPDRPEELGVPPRGERPRVPSSPEALLAPGAVGEIQDALRDRGYLGAHRRGELDRATSAALRRFQEAQGLAATGAPDRETLRRLHVDPARAYGRDEGPGGGS
ncbi:Peptidoglycan-binding domain 1 protein [Anaeromyxobacter dehalogenans 2CP-1]|uniref:Peptidoglycan-binding domain 1 protein n=1 Tax=Anaeromyxobacter dehalogenans (strain ATCC BAA-258 / DSM 21875 / 2CP-1) TaxID=455488 RepID=B8J726_ANAD2|nr:peptidoglycan-binding domain-containing protein [Anaeromyxobacter dehalogenans]ACL65216.1 Peptidoglycan-binding domain 1 protein [Anaeromyxobacter dehalogenans 2CP-1]